jgi:hypothetical protein
MNQGGTMAKTDLSLSGITEHLLFVALLIPTFILLAAVAVSLARPDPSIAAERQPAQTMAACEPCGSYDNGDQGP